jgi:hypothetical protein
MLSVEVNTITQGSGTLDVKFVVNKMYKYLSLA